MSTEIVNAKLAELHPAPWNPRHDLGDLSELAASLKSIGCNEPLIVRNRNHGSTGYEVLSGHRRLAAAKKAGLAELPVIVRDLDDKQALELALVANIQRKDIDAISEGEALRVLHEEHGIGVEELAAKVGKSTRHVYTRIQLAKGLHKDIRKKVLVGEVSASAAILYARIPNLDLQLRAFKESAFDQDDEPTPTRKIAQHLQDHYMLRLADAPFDPKDKSLVLAAGPCAPCPKLAGNQPDLFGDVKGKDLCTDPTCFDAKKKADWERKALVAKEKGQRVLNEKETGRVFDSYNGALSYNSPYVRPEDQCFEDPKGRTYAQLVGKNGPPPVLAQDRSGAAVELLDKHQAIEAARKSGAIRKESAISRDPYRAQQAREAKANHARREKQRAVMAALVAAMEAKDLGDKLWVALAPVLVECAWHDTVREVLYRRDLTPAKGTVDVRAHAKKIARELPPAQARAFGIEVALGQAGLNHLNDLAALFGVNPKKAAAAAKKPTKSKSKKKA